METQISQMAQKKTDTNFANYTNGDADFTDTTDKRKTQMAQTDTNFTNYTNRNAL